MGYHTELQVDVTIDNTGEDAYQTTIYSTTLAEINLNNLPECDFINGSYVCVVAYPIKEKTIKSFRFDLTNLNPNRQYLQFAFSIDSIGIDVKELNNKFKLQIPVVLQNTPYIEK